MQLAAVIDLLPIARTGSQRNTVVSETWSLDGGPLPSPRPTVVGHLHMRGLSRVRCVRPCWLGNQFRWLTVNATLSPPSSGSDDVNSLLP